jgi:hypothetical protein
MAGAALKYCAAWRQSFENFFADVGKRPSSKHSIDRYPDKNGNYCPDNVRWATRRQQQNNMRSNRFVVYKGQELTMAEASRLSLSNISADIIRQRLNAGWGIEAAIEAPIDLRFSRRKVDAYP